MISDVINLFDMLRTLVQRKSELDKEYFENFIQPIWQSFDLVHKNYVDTFLKCKKFLDIENMLTEKTYTSLIEILENESIIHSDARRELNKMVEHIPTSNGDLRHKLLSDLIDEINRYFVSPSWKSLRHVLEKSLYHLNKNKNQENQETTRIAIAQMLNYIKESYESVASKYYRLKKELLT